MLDWISDNWKFFVGIGVLSLFLIWLICSLFQRVCGRWKWEKSDEVIKTGRRKR